MSPILDAPILDGYSRKVYARFMDNTGLAFKPFFSNLAGAFTEHIDNSIPDYKHNRGRTASALASMNVKTLLDVGASEGTLGSLVAALSGGRIATTNIDPNRAMYETWKKRNTLFTSFRVEAWHQGFQDGDEYIPAYGGATVDAIHMSMVRQFVTRDAESWYAEAHKFLNPDGLFIVNVKVYEPDNPEWHAKEAEKDAYKAQFFTAEQMTKKAEETLVGMHSLMLTKAEEIAALQASFAYVTTYWKSCNFYGFIASDNPYTLNRFLKAY